jgi:hypothetical protein
VLCFFIFLTGLDPISSDVLLLPLLQSAVQEVLASGPRRRRRRPFCPPSPPPTRPAPTPTKTKSKNRHLARLQKTARSKTGSRCSLSHGTLHLTPSQELNDTRLTPREHPLPWELAVRAGRHQRPGVLPRALGLTSQSSTGAQWTVEPEYVLPARLLTARRPCPYSQPR